jgi:hypothetical protein
VTGLPTFSNHERAEDPSLIHEIRTHFDLGETKPAFPAAPSPVSANEAPAAAAAPSDDSAGLLIDVPYSRQVIDIDMVPDTGNASGSADATAAAFDPANLFYLHPELVTDWPEIKGRAEVMRTTKTRHGADRPSADKPSPRGALRKRFLPRSDLSGL